MTSTVCCGERMEDTIPHCFSVCFSAGTEIERPPLGSGNPSLGFMYFGSAMVVVVDIKLRVSLVK